MVDSIYIANMFNKRHDHLIHRIRIIMPYAKEHFEEVECNEGHIKKKYSMTNIGVLLLVGGFNGVENIETKIDLFKELHNNHFKWC